ncbi:MAG: VWA domain-containing protein [Planctomycetota bacterium]
MIESLRLLERSLQDGSAQPDSAGENAGQAIQTSEDFLFLALPELWLIGLVIVPALILFVRWSYGGLSRLDRGPRIALTTLRGLAIAFALFLMFQPAIERTRYTEVRSQIHVLVDDSASMTRKDTYPEEASRLALTEASGRPIDGATRSELVQRVLEKPGGLLEELAKDYDLRLYRFVRKPQPIQSLAELSSRGPRSPIGDALDLHLATAGAANLGSVLLVSDGRNNDGLDPIEVAGKYRLNDTAIYTIGVGDPNAPKNIRLIAPPGPREGLAGEELLFEVTLDAEGLEGRQVVVTLEIALEGRPYRPVDTQTATLAPDHVPAKVRLTHVFDDPGDYKLKYRVDPLGEETSSDDNEAVRFLHIDDEKIRVLFIDGGPRWDYRYLHSTLERVDESIEYQAWLADASKSFPQEASDNLPSLTDIPRTREELFQYHVILLGDIPPEKIATTEEGQQKWLELLVDFVEEGGGLGCLFGERAMPERYRNTPLVDLLPVLLESPATLRENPAPRNESFTFLMDNPATPHDVLRLLPDPENNRRLWETGFDSIDLYYPVQNVKAGATPLLRHATRGNRYGRHVLAAAGSFPRGRTFFLGIDEVWKLRNPYEDLHYDRFWRNVVRHLAAGRLARRDDRIEIQLDRVSIEAGGQVEVTVIARDDELQPLLLDSFPVYLRRADGSPERRTLSPLVTEPGTYRGRFRFEDPGSYSVIVFDDDNPTAEILGREDLLVEIPDRELTDSSQDQPTLERIAGSSEGGRYVFLAAADELAEELGGRRAVAQNIDRQTRTIWDQGWALFVLLGLLAIEWIFRKRVRLV